MYPEPPVWPQVYSPIAYLRSVAHRGDQVALEQNSLLCSMLPCLSKIFQAVWFRSKLKLLHRTTLLTLISTFSYTIRFHVEGYSRRFLLRLEVVQSPRIGATHCEMGQQGFSVPSNKRITKWIEIYCGINQYASYG